MGAAWVLPSESFSTELLFYWTFVARWYGTRTIGVAVVEKDLCKV